MKNFDDFVLSLTQEDIEWVCNNNANEPSKISINFSDSDSVQNLISNLLQRDFSISLRLLNLYHKWLSEDSD